MAHVGACRHRCAITILVPPLYLGTTAHSVSNGAPFLHAPLATTLSNGACRPRCAITNLGEARYFGSHPRDTICIDLPMHAHTHFLHLQQASSFSHLICTI